MAGLLSIALLIGWFFVAFLIARQAASGIKSSLLRFALMIPLFVVLMVLPVADELVGGFQFRALCREKAVLKIDAEKIKGKTIRLVTDPSNKDVDNTAVRIYYSHHSYRDTETQEELASFNDYAADGGILFRFFAMGNHMPPLIPMTIDPRTSNASNSCSHYATQADLAAKYGFTFLQLTEKK